MSDAEVKKLMQDALKVAGTYTNDSDATAMTAHYVIIRKFLADGMRAAMKHDGTLSEFGIALACAASWFCHMITNDVPGGLTEEEALDLFVRTVKLVHPNIKSIKSVEDD